MQQTCPPKQTRQGLFEDYNKRSRRSGGDGRNNDDDDDGDGVFGETGIVGFREKLEASRRKSLAFKPKVGSPLALDR